MKELVNIQGELKAPKDKRNNFGGYNYRSCEGIMEAVKPLLKKYSCTLVVEDEIVMMGNRYYVRAMATIKNKDGECECATAYARESETKKGMDDAQVTGSTSSYARKYALNGLLCIDDNKDADDINTHGKVAQPCTAAPAKVVARPAAAPSMAAQPRTAAPAKAAQPMTAQPMTVAAQPNMAAMSAEEAKVYEQICKMQTVEEMKELCKGMMADGTWNERYKTMFGYVKKEKGWN